ncbi:MAG TPA: HNH endonuclease signature motif containing protein [Candidatus Polarisedimenticolia bacterium]|nr:HNH endonuclease signature motif containing protein [Candidatus Polarisedimenticolia bacterium]
MMEFFNAKCAYCERTLPSRWHADHLVSVDKGGFNHVSNRVPACPQCNEQEKHEMAWLLFLDMKSSGDALLLANRRARIEAWMALNKPSTAPVTDEQRLAWKTEVQLLSSAIDDAWKRLKSTRSL